MVDIAIHHKHQQDTVELRQQAESLARQLAEKYQLQTEWREDVLIFHRSGIKGQLLLATDVISLEVSLGLLMKPFKKTFEREIRQFLTTL